MSVRFWECVHLFMACYTLWCNRPWYCWKGALSRAQTPSSPDWHSSAFWSLHIPLLHPLSCYCALLSLLSPLLDMMPGVFFPLQCPAFWPINGVPPNPGEVWWQVQGTAVLGPCYAFDLGHSLLPYGWSYSTDLVTLIFFSDKILCKHWIFPED